MLDLKTGLLIFGLVFLLLLATRKVTRKGKNRATSLDVSANKAAAKNAAAKTSVPASIPRMTEEQFNKAWKGLSYLMLLAAAGNLYMMYNAIQGALETQSYILWIDAGFSLAAAVIAVLIWRLHLRNLVIAYMVITVIPIMFFMSTGHSMDGIIRLFPLVLVYFAVKPVWEYMDQQARNAAQNS